MATIESKPMTREGQLGHDLQIDDVPAYGVQADDQYPHDFAHSRETQLDFSDGQISTNKLASEESNRGYPPSTDPESDSDFDPHRHQSIQRFRTGSPPKSPQLQPDVETRDEERVLLHHPFRHDIFHIGISALNGTDVWCKIGVTRHARYGPYLRPQYFDHNLQHVPGALLHIKWDPIFRRSRFWGGSSLKTWKSKRGKLMYDLMEAEKTRPEGQPLRLYSLNQIRPRPSQVNTKKLWRAPGVAMRRKSRGSRLLYLLPRPRQSGENSCVVKHCICKSMIITILQSRGAKSVDE